VFTRTCHYFQSWTRCICTEFLPVFKIWALNRDEQVFHLNLFLIRRQAMKKSVLCMNSRKRKYCLSMASVSFTTRATCTKVQNRQLCGKQKMANWNEGCCQLFKIVSFHSIKWQKGMWQKQIFIFLLKEASRNISVGRGTGYGLDDRMIGVRFPAGTGNFSLRHRVQIGCGVHPTSYPMGTGGSFLGGKAAG
jgi:hypothetical protein